MTEHIQRYKIELQVKVTDLNTTNAHADTWKNLEISYAKEIEKDLKNQGVSCKNDMVAAVIYEFVKEIKLNPDDHMNYLRTLTQKLINDV